MICPPYSLENDVVQQEPAHANVVQVKRTKMSPLGGQPPSGEKFSKKSCLKTPEFRRQDVEFLEPTVAHGMDQDAFVEGSEQSQPLDFFQPIPTGPFLSSMATVPFVDQNLLKGKATVPLDAPLCRVQIPWEGEPMDVQYSPPCPRVQIPFEEVAMEVTEVDDVWVTTEMMEDSLRPIYEALEDTQATEDNLFTHVREILQWKQTVDETWNLDIFKQDVSTLTQEVVKQFTDQSAQQFEEWNNSFALETLNLLSQGNLGAESMSKDLRDVWSTLSTRLETLNVTCQAQEGQLQKFEGEWPAIVQLVQAHAEFLRAQVEPFLAREQSHVPHGPPKQLEEDKVKQFVTGMIQRHAATLQASIDHVHTWCQNRFAQVE